MWAYTIFVRTLFHQTNTETLPFFTCKSNVGIAFTLFMIVCSVYSGTGAVESWFKVDIEDLRGFGRQAARTVLFSLVGFFGLIGRIRGTLLLKIS